MKETKRKLFSIHEEIMDRDNDCGDDHHVFDEDEGSSVRQSTTCADFLLDWIIFPLLLFMQFGTTMYCQHQLGTLELQLIPTFGWVSLFCVSSVKYRVVFREHPIQSITLLLLPEVFTNIILAMVMFMSDLEIALETLIVLTVVLLIAAFVGEVQLTKYKRSATLPKASDYHLLHAEENDDVVDEYVC